MVYTDAYPACRPPRSCRFFLDTVMRRGSNASSGGPGEVPDNQVNAHLGNPGLVECPRRTTMSFY
jgi:hypothetical protein